MLAHFFAGCLIAAAAAPEFAPPRLPAPDVRIPDVRVPGIVVPGIVIPGIVIPGIVIPDIVVPGTRSIKVELIMDAQPLVDHCCTQHVVVKGETLSKIAADHRKNILTGADGSPDRVQATTVKDIVALNPGLNPDKLAIGQRIWMPPRIPTATKTENTFVFLDQRWPFGGLGSPFAAADILSAPRRGKTAITLVPASELERFNKARTSRDWKEIESVKKSDKITTLSIGGSGHSVWDESPVYSCKDTIKIVRSKKGVFSAKLTSVAYNKAGDIVPPEERNKDHRKNKKGFMWFLLLPLAGGSWLLWRRRQENASAPAVA